MALDLSAFNDKKATAPSKSGGVDLSSFDTFHALRTGQPVSNDADKYDTWKSASPLGKTWQVVKGLPMAAWQTIGGNVAKFGASALAAPIDIYRGIKGQQPMQGETGGVLGLPPTKTFQAEAANSLGESFDRAYSGGYEPKTLNEAIDQFHGIGHTPITDTARAVLPTVLAGAETLGAAEIAANPVKFAKDVTGAVKSGYKAASEALGNVTKKTVSALSKDLAESKVTNAIEAIDPNLSGKKAVNAYKEVVTGSRDVKPSSVFSEQSLTPNERTVNLGTRLSSDIELADGSSVKGVQFSKDPATNLKELKSALDDTEAKLNSALENASGDPEIVMNADKQSAYEKLDSIKTEMPREFSQIRDQKKLFGDVVDFAKKLINKADDSISGLRSARSEFDSIAKRNYPSAYTDGGSIDTRTPAGAAIKQVRDTMNEHMYNTAPNGSDIQKLIAREADIFRATDSIAPKAAKFDAMGTFGKIYAQHPGAVKTAGAVIGGTAIAGGLKGAVDTTKAMLP